MNCKSTTKFSKSILAQLVLALKSAFIDSDRFDVIIFEISLRYCGLFLISTSRVGNCCWSEMLILILCNPQRLNSVSSRFGMWWVPFSAGHESWHEMTVGIDVSVSVVVVEQVRYLFSIALYLSSSLWLLSSLLTLCTPFRIISTSIGSKHAIFFLCPPWFWRGKTSSGFVIFNWMDSVFMDMFTSHSGEPLVAKSQRTCFLLAPERVSILLWTNLLRPLFTNSMLFELTTSMKRPCSFTCNISSHCCEIQICQVG